MKKMRKILPAFAMLVLAAVLMSTASYAWFSTNKKVEATGIQVNVQAPSSLVITTTFPTSSNVDSTAALSANGQATTLSPITYDTINTVSGYYIPQAAATVDSTTGLITNLGASGEENEGGIAAAGDKGLELISTKDGYYVDYVVYISAAGQAMTGKTLTATVTFVNTKTDEQDPPQPLPLESTQLATTVAFAYQTVTRSEGELDVSDSTTDFPLTQTPYVKICANDSSKSAAIHSGTIDIPLNSDTTTALAVTMRVYIDGAQGSLVNSKNFNLDALKINVAFNVN